MATSSEGATSNSPTGADPTAASSPPGMTVGIDGSPSSTKALHWAAARTEQFGPIQPVAVWSYPWWSFGSLTPGAPPPPPASAFAAWATAEAEQVLGDIDDDRHLPLMVSGGRAGPILVAAGESSRLLVVGTRGHGALLDVVLGSVSEYCVTHARVPVAVIPSHAALDDPAGRVVVGVDGSENSVAALTWALEHTSASVDVDAVMAWGVPATMPGFGAFDLDRDRERAAATLEETIADALSRATGIEPDRAVGRVLDMGDARDVLDRNVVGADMLVIGSVGGGTIQRLLVGSVATAMVHQPALPTIVVPHTDRPEPEPIDHEATPTTDS